jgi:hypothetical protein
MRQQLNTEDIPRIFDVLEDGDVFWQGVRLPSGSIRTEIKQLPGGHIYY